EKVTDQVGVDVFRTPAHVVPFKAAHPSANGRFDFSLRSHAKSPTLSSSPLDQRASNAFHAAIRERVSWASEQFRDNDNSRETRKSKSPLADLGDLPCL